MLTYYLYYWEGTKNRIVKDANPHGVGKKLGLISL